ncbi:MAG TPA: transketolase C-terminal domain-containing protein, partial [Turneriella sp.]|nr:transketolase C-terminal domain-containing protein [Turneriella sp.]
GVARFDPNYGIEQKAKSTANLSKFVGETLAHLGGIDKTITVITPAMKEGSGLAPFADRFPSRFFDTGIAEQHATAFAGALANTGLKPFLCIYSTFLQRGYDQLVQDIALMNLPVRLVIDRAGCVGQDGETHQGFYDIAFMAPLPHIKILSARDATELVRMLTFAAHYNESPLAIRFPKKEYALFDIAAVVQSAAKKKYNPFTAESLASGKDVLILSEGVFAAKALESRALLAKKKIAAAVLDVRSLKPLPTKQILNAVKNKKLIVTLENHGLVGGLGDLTARLLTERNIKIKHLALGYPDTVVAHGSIGEIEKQYGLTAEKIAESIYHSL